MLPRPFHTGATSPVPFQSVHFELPLNGFVKRFTSTSQWPMLKSKSGLRSSALSEGAIGSSLVRVTSAIQFASQVWPRSAEKACSK